MEATSTSRDLKVILIGGSPMSGKTTLAMTLAARFGYACMSTDDIGEIVSTVADAPLSQVRWAFVCRDQSARPIAPVDRGSPAGDGTAPRQMRTRFRPAFLASYIETSAAWNSSSVVVPDAG